jgi:hypothetical protein
MNWDFTSLVMIVLLLILMSGLMYKIGEMDGIKIGRQQIIQQYKLK